MALLGFTVMSTAWALAVPLAGGVDEPSHMIRAEAVARGELLTDKTDGRHNLVYGVSPTVGNLWAQLCFIYDRNAPASCAPPVTSATEPETFAATGAGRYNPLYYSAIGWTTRALPGEPGLYAMRLVSALLSSVMLASSVLMVRSLGRDSRASVALAVGLTPMVVALSGVVNPNAIEVAAGLAFFSAAAAYVISPSRELVRERAGVMCVSGVFLANARALSPVWLVALAAAALLFGDRAKLDTIRKYRATYVTIGVGVIAAAASAGWTLSSQSLTVSVPYDGTGTPFVRGFFTVLARTFEYAPDWIGVFGWGQIPLPAVALFAVGAVMFVLVSVAIFFGSRAGRRSVATLAAILALAPAAIQGSSVDDFGYVWQGRYILVLVPPLVLAAALALAEPLAKLSAAHYARLQRLALAAFVPLHVLGLAVLIKGYSGTDATWGSIIRAPLWSPPGGIFALLALVGVGASLVAVSILGPFRSRRARTASGGASRASA